MKWHSSLPLNSSFLMLSGIALFCEVHSTFFQFDCFGFCTPQIISAMLPWKEKGEVKSISSGFLPIVARGDWVPQKGIHLTGVSSHSHSLEWEVVTYHTVQWCSLHPTCNFIQLTYIVLVSDCFLSCVTFIILIIFNICLKRWQQTSQHFK